MKKTNFLPLLFSCLFLFSFQVKSQNSMNMTLLSQWKDSSITGSLLYNNAFNEVWGYTRNNREYAIIGSSRGTHFFDVTNPSSIVEVDFVQGRDTGKYIVHRDYHDYKNYLYMVTDEGNGSLQIVDLTYLPDSVHLVYDDNTKIKLSHNIFIDTATDKLYSCGGGNAEKFNVFSLANPLSPQRLYRGHIDISWWATTVGSGGYVHDVYSRNDTVYCNAGNGLYVVDFSGTTPTLLASLKSYPDGGYNHSGWLSEDGNTYTLTDETWGKKVKFFDVSNLNSIQFLDTIGSNITSNSIPHNVITKGDYAYVAYYYDGTYIYNIADPSNPYLTGYYRTSTETNYRSYKGNWGIYPFLPSGILLASDMQNGLFVLKVSDATSLAKLDRSKRFKIFPNPFVNNLKLIGLSNFNEKYSIRLTDINGREILNKKLENKFLKTEKIDLPANLPKGIYVVTIFNSNFTQTKKLIKQ